MTSVQIYYKDCRINLLFSICKINIVQTSAQYVTFDLVDPISVKGANKKTSQEWDLGHVSQGQGSEVPSIALCFQTLKWQ